MLCLEHNAPNSEVHSQMPLNLCLLNPLQHSLILCKLIRDCGGIVQGIGVSAEISRCHKVSSHKETFNPCVAGVSSEKT